MLFLIHDLQIGEVHLPIKAAVPALGASSAIGASMAKAACPILTFVSRVTGQLPCKDL